MKQYRFIFRQNKEIKSVNYMLNNFGEACEKAEKIENSDSSIIRVRIFEVISAEEVKFLTELC